MFDPPAQESILSVSQLTYRIKNVIERSIEEIWVEGEISNFVHHGSGHMYFSLKDRDAQIRCAMFKGKNRQLRFRPTNGALVRARGSISVWPPQGTYQLYVEEMQPSGIGALHQAFEELKARLHREGLFDARHKKPIPKFPRKVGVVTSPTGAAIRDIVNVISRRYPLTDLVLCPARVQGEGAAVEIARAIRTFDGMSGSEKPDVLIVGRGGG
ncbi:MAG TPA: exodeoxyribonuclease VII large subunit, partial [bacterium]|nr:exodeoxyribonuclease VII large subunit [bacterium]